MNEYVMTLVGSTIAGIVSFFLGVQKTKKEVEGMALTNVQTSLDIYKVIIDDLKVEITTLLLKVDDLENKIDELKQENEQLREQLREMMENKK